MLRIVKCYSFVDLGLMRACQNKQKIILVPSIGYLPKETCITVVLDTISK